MRINKYIASCGVASRRKAEELINAGRVKVNGKIINELSFQVDENNDRVEVDEKLIGLEERLVYIMLNKPEGYVTTVKDQFDRKSVIDLVKDVGERVYPIGRLDYETSGLLLLTNDGDLTYKLTHPKHEVDKTYIATLKGIPTLNEMKNFEKGLYIEDYKTAPAKIKVLKKNEEKNYCVCEIKIHEGRNRQVRKMCRAINHPVMNLRRKAMGKIVLKDVEIGQYRYLTQEEIDYLKTVK
ncbi:ribosomal large subunit pseudouridine synthase B [[Clostridium] sordellii]|uniref:Pseudouridine synthase n=1 Tax=Paraclostridium sordellii TaxID=1505 RepID=A0A0A1SKH7_PARSO|nr:pseudouridine synthase [Paeniclostridium sordellii]MDU5021432.1 pseudouridine synthase [Clostridiales bacterium]AUN14666.1 pseudouridine synthase [Paeniclostridium sordellii]EPZ56746.1 ribosomal large subunit pseudouridine synthase B [[Clostridium] sordellii VPI 9048] [Paeniclostridium sordellii VPI 9048]MBX9181700.1 rRNA pseudouridine synthase [Paeniclostridium sordellii]MCH1966573.1 rRNA pseudouridine synthase [Paeniclostridium sordellii]